MILISNIVLEVFDGSTIASTNIYGADRKVYVNIGSGDVLKLKWNAPTLANDTVNYYNLVIKRYDPTLSVYYDIFDRNIGLVNEFYINSDMLPAAPEQYLLHIYLVAHSKKGVVITSDVVSAYVCKGSGTYIKAKAGNTEYMKRALGFVNASTTSAVTARILDTEGNEVSIPGTSENPVATRLLSSSSWNIMQESSVKDTNGSWRNSDIKYEVLLDKNNEIITDSSDQLIYTL